MSALDGLSYAGNALLPAGAVALLVALLRDPALQARTRAYVEQLEVDLRVLQVGLTGRRAARLQLSVLAGLVALAAACGSAWPLLPALPLVLAPAAVLRNARTRRSAAIDLQLDGFLLALSNALKASPSLGDALAACVPLLASPLRDELGLVLREQQLGVPLDRALANMAERVRSPVVSAAIATLRIARNTGGNLNRTLERAAASLRELARLEGVVRSKTAEGRAQTLVIALIPVPLIWGLDALDPEFLAPVWTTGGGHLVLAAAIALWAVALLLARKIIEVDV
ncbi:MAG TPA: type II secretion system F family protein [Polyangiales bacterium]|nr:type II secretion system F family protein [Polyangiales bacterium]